MAEKTGRSVWYRIKLVPGSGDKTSAVVQIRAWLFFWKDHYHSDNRRRWAATEFIDKYNECVELLQLYDESQNDEKEAIKYASDYRKRQGISASYEGTFIKREDELIDPGKDFTKLRKKFEKGELDTHGRMRRGRVDVESDSEKQTVHHTKSKYYLDKSGILPPTFSHYGVEFDHLIEYDSNRAKRQQQNQQKGSNRNQSRGQKSDRRRTNR